MKYIRLPTSMQSRTTSIRFVEPLEKEILEELTQESFIPEGVAVEEITEDEHDMVQQELF